MGKSPVYQMKRGVFMYNQGELLLKAMTYDHPEEIPVSADTVYTARWSREVGYLLQTDTHITYIDGYSDGLFRPNKNVTRAKSDRSHVVL